MRNSVIAIVGAPGTGKTYLSELLSKELNATYVIEPPLLPRILENFNENKRNLETQLYFFEKGIENIHASFLASKEQLVVMDSYWMSTLQYLDAMLDEFETDMARSLTTRMSKHLQHPDVIVWLTASDDHIVDNVHKRSRSFEVSEEHMQKILRIQKAHKQNFAPIAHITIDKSETDFEDGTAVTLLAERIKNLPVFT